MATDQIGLVMAGAGARGAYEAGALATWLRESGCQYPKVLVGTSSGAINVLLLASMAHETNSELLATELVRRWQESDRSTVFTPLIPAGLRAALRYAAIVSGVGSWFGRQRPRLINVLNNAPLRATVEDPNWLNWDQLHENVNKGVVSAVGVAATRVSDGRTVVFLELAPHLSCPPNDDARGIDYVQVQLGPSHLLGSACIPGLFPAEQIRRPYGDDNWYIDGGARLNTPIKPALVLGAGKVVVISSNSDKREQRKDGTSTPPDVFDAASQLLRSALADGMIEDFATLRSINQSLAAAAPGLGSGLKQVPHCFLGPDNDREIAGTARKVYETEYRSLYRRLRRPDFPIMSAIFDGGTTTHDDTFSNYFFDRAFLNALVFQGQSDAEKLLKQRVWTCP